MLREGIEINDINRLADKLLHEAAQQNSQPNPSGGLRAAAAVGRTLLLSGQPEAAKQVFEHLLDRISPTDNPEHYILVGNLGYAYLDLEKYDDAIACFNEVKVASGNSSIYEPGADFQVWHALALAYAYLRKGDTTMRDYWLGEAKKMPGYYVKNDQEFWKRLYPGMEGFLQSREADQPNDSSWS